jgi:ABC-2 type transport system permease protein
MISFLRATAILWRTHLFRGIRSKRFALVFLGCLVPPAIAFAVLTFSDRPPAPIEVFLFPSWILVMQLMVPLAAVIAGSGVISEEIEDRTITYLLTRPFPRPAVLVGRWLATLTVLLALVGGSVLALGAVVERKAATYEPPPREEFEVPGRRGRPARTVVVEGPAPELVAATEGGKLPDGLLATVAGVALLGATVYSALFAALGTFNKHPMVLGLGYCFAVEGLLANLPGKNQSWTVQFYLRSLLVDAHPDLWRLMPEFQEMRLDALDGTREAALTLIVVLVLALAIGSLVIRRKQYELTA